MSSASAFAAMLFGLTSLRYEAVSNALTPSVVSKERLGRVSQLVSTALGDAGGGRIGESCQGDSVAKLRRYELASSAAREFGGASLASESEGPSQSGRPPAHELVYGELSVPVLATILDAVRIEDGEKFLDIGSGDGALVLGASLLYAEGGIGRNAISVARGVEIIPGLVERSKQHAANMESLIQTLDTSDPLTNMADIDIMLGDVHRARVDGKISSLLIDTTLAVCFATTWSAGNAKLSSAGERRKFKSRRAQKTSLQGRALPKLSSALMMLPRGARVVIIDGKLDIRDGFEWQGDLRVYCPDTAPYSTATLYERR